MAAETPSPQDSLGRGRAPWRRVAGVLCLGAGVGLALLTYLRGRPVEVTLEYEFSGERLRGAPELVVAIRSENDGAFVSESVFRCPADGACPASLRHPLRLPRGAYRVSASARAPEGDLYWERVVRVEGEGTLHVPFDKR